MKFSKFRNFQNFEVFHTIMFLLFICSSAVQTSAADILEEEKADNPLIASSDPLFLSTSVKTIVTAPTSIPTGNAWREMYKIKYI